MKGTTEKTILELWRPQLGRLLLTVLPVAVILALFLQFAGWVEGRAGAVLDDPLLALLPAFDLSLPIFALIYGGLVAAIILLRRHPGTLLHLLRAYGAMVLIRIVTMWATPLDPPTGMILLVDPLAGIGPGGALTRDLFFSGHTATMVLLALGMQRGAARWSLAVAALLLAALLLLQHVHYTVDILVAPFVAWSCYYLSAPERSYMPGP